MEIHVRMSHTIACNSIRDNLKLNRGLDKWWSIYTTEYSTAVKRRGLVPLYEQRSQKHSIS